jgi:aminoacrylate hydrolase
MPFVTSQGVQIHYEMIGSIGSPIILSAGMGGAAHFWNPQVLSLSKRHRVILYDQAGSGKSSREIIGQQSIKRMAEDALAVLDALMISEAHFVGHAIGAIVGIELAQIDSSRLRSLLVINAWAKADAYLTRCFEVRKKILQSSGSEAYVEAQPLFLYPPKWISEHDALLKEDGKTMIANFPLVDLLLEKINLFLEYDGSTSISNINLPTLVTTAADDFLVPSYLTKELHALIKNSQFVELDWGGHAFTSARADTFNQLALDFFKKVDA